MDLWRHLLNPPPGVVPCRSFRGGGSGSWGSAALALGTGRRCLRTAMKQRRKNIKGFAP
jgi:hypothetical protein